MSLVLAVLGLVLIIWGTALLSLPAAIIVVGLILLRGSAALDPRSTP